MKCRAVALAAAVLVLSPAAEAIAQDRDWDAIEVETIQVADGLYMLVGSGGNLGLSVGADGAFLVDDQYAPLTDKIKAAVMAVTDMPVKFVVNTHWHGDHTGGNENFGEAGALIVAHDNVRKRMNPEAFEEVMGNSDQAPAAALPVITFTDRTTFHWNGETIYAQHVAHAHTDGDSIIWFENANAVHMGDNFFNGTYPFIDVDSGGNVNGMIRAAGMVLEHATEGLQVIPGHGPLSNPDELQAFHDMLVAVRDNVSGMLHRGMDADAIVAAKPSSDWDDTLGAGWMSPERFVRAVVASLQAGSPQ